MNFCSHCGSDALAYKIPPGDQLPRYICTQCDRVHYQNPKMVTGAIPVLGDKILLARRGIEPRKGFWNLPCGFLELNETLEEGAVREVKEETGVDISLSYLHTVYNLPHANQVYIIFLAQVLNQNFTVNTESTEIKLFDFQDIPWDEIAFSSNTFAIKGYLSDLENGFNGVHLGTFRKSLL